MRPDVSENDSPLAYRLRLIHRAALIRKTANTNSKKAQTLHKKNYDKHVRFGSRFAAGDYVLIERPPLLASAARHMAYKGDLRLLPSRTELYQVICV